MRRQIIIFSSFTIFNLATSGQNNVDTIHYFSDLFPESGIFLRPDSLQDGEWIAHCETNKSQVGLKFHYKNGRRNGESISFWPNGKIQQRSFYKDGYLVGKDEKWYKNGTKESESICEEVDYNEEFSHCSLFNFWSKTGVQLIKDGTGKYLSFYDNDTLQVVGEYLNGVKIGKWTWYYKTGAVQYIEHFKNGKQDGAYVFYYINGQIRNKGIYANGKQIGKWEHWYQDGKKEELEFRIDGKRDGEYKYWYSNGQLSYLGNYKLGKEEGIWKHWDEKGKLEAVEKYLDGKLIETRNYR